MGPIFRLSLRQLLGKWRIAIIVLLAAIPVGLVAVIRAFNADLLADLERLTASFDSERSMRAFTAVDRALAALERNASPKVVADWLVLQL